jgi:hypothetical protein
MEEAISPAGERQGAFRQNSSGRAGLLGDRLLPMRPGGRLWVAYALSFRK